MNGKIAEAIGAVAVIAMTALPADLFAQPVDLEERPRNAKVTIQIDNGNWLDVRIYAVRNGNIYDRVGTVRSFSSREFELPRWVTATDGLLQLVVVPIGSRQRYRAPPVMVSAGDVIEWKLTNNLRHSSISVRAG